jgi:hypothetical protein
MIAPPPIIKGQLAVMCLSTRRRAIIDPASGLRFLKFQLNALEGAAW